MSDDVIIKGELGYNRQDPKAGPVLIFAAGILVTLLMCFIFVIAYYGWALEGEQYRFQQVPVAQDYKNLQASADQLLHQTAYSNKEKTGVRLTVERAMELFLQESQAKKAFYPTAPAPVKVDAALVAAAPAAEAGKPADTKAADTKSEAKPAAAKHEVKH